MTMDERLDRLVERHAALSQSVELLTKDVRELGQSVGELGKYVGEVAEGTARLLHIAQFMNNALPVWKAESSKQLGPRMTPKENHDRRIH